MRIQCPFCGTVNEAGVQQAVLRPPLPCIGPVWTCTICEESWTDEDAEAILDRYHQDPHA